MSSKAEAVGMKVLKTFKSDVFHGLSVEAANDTVNTLEAHTEVRKAWAMARISLAPVRPLQTFADDAAAANYSIHQYTGVDKAHAAGMLGKGVTVAVVDTGTDYKHPAVGFPHPPLRHAEAEAHRSSSEEDSGLASRLPEVTTLSVMEVCAEEEPFLLA